MKQSNEMPINERTGVNDKSKQKPKKKQRNVDAKFDANRSKHQISTCILSSWSLLFFCSHFCCTLCVWYNGIGEWAIEIKICTWKWQSAMCSVEQYTMYQCVCTIQHNRVCEMNVPLNWSFYGLWIKSFIYTLLAQQHDNHTHERFFIFLWTILVTSDLCVLLFINVFLTMRPYNFFVFTWITHQLIKILIYSHTRDIYVSHTN